MLDIKMIVCDLDGTLLTKKERVSSATITAFTKAKAQGIKIAIATARIAQSVDVVLSQNKLRPLIDIAICMNGFDIYDYSLAKSLKNLKLSEQQKEKIIGKCTISNGQFIDGEESFIFRRTESFSADEIDFLLSLATSEYFVRLLSPGEIGFFPSGFGKAAAIEYVAGLYNFTLAEVLAFGDQSNDIDMLQRCGYGIAMANSSKEVLAVADWVTDSNNHNGIANFLNEFVLID